MALQLKISPLDLLYVNLDLVVTYFLSYKLPIGRTLRIALPRGGWNGKLTMQGLFTRHRAVKRVRSRKTLAGGKQKSSQDQAGVLQAAGKRVVRSRQGVDGEN